MTAGTMNARYAANAVYGNVAYDLNRTRDFALPQEEYAPPATAPDERTRERTRENVHVQTKEQAAFGLPVFGVIGFVAAAIVVVFMLFGYVQLAEVSASTTELKSTISQLDEQSTKLRVRYESTFNLNEIEGYAINVLGMTKLTDANTTVFGAEKTDKAEILNSDDSAKGLLSRATDFLESLAEYFN